MKTMTEAVLNVLLHGEAIGTLTQLGGDRTLFAFNDDYIEKPRRPTLSLSFRGEAGGLLLDHRPTRRRVPPFFANLLPEGHLRRYLAAKAGVNETRDFPLLRALGGDLAGAVQVMPSELVVVAEPAEDDEGSTANGPLRFSLAGVQLKLSALEAATGGLTIPARGAGGDWILKLPSAVYPGIPENEFAIMQLATQVGVETPEVRLVNTEDVQGLPNDLGELASKALAVRRFDRGPSGAVHIEDFAQVFRLYPERKYERASYRNIAEVLWNEVGEEAIDQFARRLTFSALIGNADMHLKNWSLIYPDGATPALSPAYDLLSTIAYLPDETMALRLGRSKRWRDLTLDQIRHFAARSSIPEGLAVEAATETVTRFRQSWPAEAPHLGLPASTTTIIDRHLASLPIAKEI